MPGCRGTQYAPRAEARAGDLRQAQPVVLQRCAEDRASACSSSRGARRRSTRSCSGLDETNALFEARRCLSCGNCFECDNCYGVCPDNAVIKLGPGQAVRVQFRLLQGLRDLRVRVPVRRDQDGAGVDLMARRHPAGAAGAATTKSEECAMLQKHDDKAVTAMPTGARAAAGPVAQQGHRVHRGRARRAAPARTAAAARVRRRSSSSGACSRTSGASRRPREVHQPRERCTTATRRCSFAC